MALKTTLAAALFAAAALSVLSRPALADHDERGWRGGDIRHFAAHDMHRWRGGRWIHARHGGYLGWWWVVAGAWYFYSAPVYPYPDPYVPPVVVEQQAPPAVVQQAAPPPAAPQYWYYCEPANAYYPYVSTCPTGWKKLPAMPPGAPQ